MQGRWLLLGREEQTGEDPKRKIRTVGTENSIENAPISKEILISSGRSGVIYFPDVSWRILHLRSRYN